MTFNKPSPLGEFLKNLTPHHEHRANLWLAKTSWPLGNATYSFLPQAIDEIGKTLFQSLWEGALDIAAYHIPALPLICRAEPWDHENALKILRENQSQIDIPEEQFEIASDVEWQTASSLIDVHNEDARPRIARYEQVVQTIVSAAQADKLIMALRPVRGGQFTKAPSWWWNTEILDPRFALCQLNPDEPFGLDVAGKSHSYIFVERESLAALCSSVAETIDGPDKRTPSYADDRSTTPNPNTATHYRILSLSGRKQQLVFQALTEIWPDGWVPRGLTIADIENHIDPIMKTKGDAGGAGADNIRRALGLKGA